MASLNTALSVASGSLQALQTQLSVASSNVSNADVDGYTRKTATKTSLATSGAGTGVSVTSITSNVDPWLLKSIYSATSTSSASSTTSSYLQELGDSLGALSSDSSTSGDNLSSELTTLSSALTELAATSTDSTLKSSVVSSVSAITTSLRSASATVQDLRKQADTAIGNTVDSINSDLESINTLNKSIVRAAATGQSTADLEDQRASVVSDLSSYIGITTFTKEDGALAVYTSGGTALLDSSVHSLSFSTAGTVTASSSYASGTLSGIVVDATLDSNGDPVSGTGTDITSKVNNGSLSSLITLRDTTLPAVQTKLNSVATSLMSGLNTAHNAGTGSSQANSLTGSVTGLGSASLTGSGTLTVAVTDQAGTIVASSTFDLSSYGTVSDLVTDINADATLSSYMSASIDASTGKVTLAATNSSEGVALSGGSVTAVGSTTYSSGVTLSAALGLNDLVTGTDATDITVRSDILSSPTLLATDVLSSSGVVASDSQVQSIADSLDSSGVATTAANLITSVSSDLKAIKATASANETALSTLTSSFSSKYGVNLDEESATIQSLSQSYAASAQVVSTVKSMFDSLLSAVQS